jgi:hypothetical protein
MRLKAKHWELAGHMGRFVDGHRFPGFQIGADELSAFIERESSGRGEVHEALLWAKKCEEITLTQMWHEMAELWSGGDGWYYPWRSNLSHLWADRRGNNLFVRKLLAMARFIKKKGCFMEAMLACSYFTDEDRSRYLERKYGRV